MESYVDIMVKLMEFMDKLEKNSHEDHKHTGLWILGILNAIGSAWSYAALQSQVAALASKVAALEGLEEGMGGLQDQIGRQREQFEQVQDNVQDICEDLNDQRERVRVFRDRNEVHDNLGKYFEEVDELELDTLSNNIE